MLALVHFVLLPILYDFFSFSSFEFAVKVRIIHFMFRFEVNTYFILEYVLLGLFLELSYDGGLCEHNVCHARSSA